MINLQQEKSILILFVSDDYGGNRDLQCSTDNCVNEYLELFRMALKMINLVLGGFIIIIL